MHGWKKTVLKCINKFMMTEHVMLTSHDDRKLLELDFDTTAFSPPSSS
jgi:hypothetical protein